MQSYLKITKDTKTKVIKIEAELHEGERAELVCIRHYIVEQITGILSPQCNSIEFKWSRGG